MSTIFPITENPRFGIYTASEGQTLFALAFPFQADRDISVLKLVSDDWVAVPLGSGFTASGAGSPTGGSVTLITPAVDGEQYLVLGQAILDRLSSIVRDGKYKSILVDAELDRVRLIHQEIWREIKRAVKAPYGEIGPELSRDLGNGDILMLQGNKLIAGPNATDIAGAQGYAEEAKDARDEAVALADDIGDLGAARDEAVAAKEAAEDARDVALSALSSFVIGGYGLVLPELRAYLFYLYTNGLSEPRRLITNALDDFVGACVDCDVWAQIIAANLLFLHSGPASLVNVKNPGTLNLTALGGITHEPGIGYQGDAGAKYLGYGVGPNAVAGWTRYAGGMGLLSTGASTTGNRFSTTNTGGTAVTGFGMAPSSPSGNQNIRFNNTALYAIAGQSRDGFAATIRQSDAVLNGYRDGTLIGTSTQATDVNLSASALSILRSGSTYEDGWAHAAFLFTGSVTPEMMAVLNGALADLRQRIGDF